MSVICQSVQRTLSRQSYHFIKLVCTWHGNFYAVFLVLIYKVCKIADIFLYKKLKYINTIV